MIPHKILTQGDVRGGRLADYYMDSLDDYYAKDGNAFSWQGKGADTLNLSGNVEEETFKDLLRGRLPDGTLLRTSQREDSKSRVGIDLTFAPPKSVSIQALIGRDHRIVEAHDRAVAATLEQIEKVAAQTRKKIDGKTHVENTANLIVAKFRHETNREMEPQLHTHAIVMNLTQREDGAWRALVNDKIVQNTKLFDAHYISELAMNLESLGLTLRQEGSSFELAHITREQIEACSVRSQQVEKYLSDRGLNRMTASSEEKNLAALATRKAKKEIGKAELALMWQSLAKDLAIDFTATGHRYSSKEIEKSINLAAKNGVGGQLEKLSREEAADRAVSFAIEHLTERQSIVGQTSVSVVASEHSLGKATTTDIAAALDRAVQRGKLLESDPVYREANDKNATPLTRQGMIEQRVKSGESLSHAKISVDNAIKAGRLIQLAPRYTTQRAIDRERRILDRELKGRSAVPSILSDEKVTHALEKTTLRPDQARAVRLSLTTQNQIHGWQGLAGVGKSYALKHLKEIAETSGYKVVVLAPYGAQVKSLRADGIDDAMTLASYLHSSRRDPLNDKTLVCVDESGVIPTKLMDKLTALIEKEGGRLNLIGDIGQTKAIEEGAPFKLLQRAGMEFDSIDEIQRQRANPVLAKAVRLAAEGKTMDAVKMVSDVREISTEETRLQALAKAYTDLPPRERQNTLVVTGTNETRKILNNLIRQELGCKNDASIMALARHDSTQEERRFARYYSIGDIVQPEINYKRSGLIRSALYEVVDNAGNTLTLRDRDGTLRTISPTQHRKMSVYKPYQMDVGQGDMIRVTRNNASLDLANGDLLTVRNVTPDSIELTDGNRIIDLPRAAMMHMEPGYVSTVHGSQGLTADRVLGNIDTPSKTVADDWFYVLISRAKNEVSIFTDKANKLPDAVARKSIKHAAIQLEHKVTREMVHKLERFSNKEFKMD